MRDHEYRPLDRSRREIRLLKILSPEASWAAAHVPLECATVTVSLDAGPQFVALSYVWGSSVRGTPLVLDGMRAQVTESLDAALRGVFRPASVPRGLLWADALCINQADDAEKSWQVALMSAIYPAAASVLCWLGAASRDSDLALRQLRDCALGFRRARLAKQSPGPAAERPWHAEAAALQQLDGPVHNLMRRAWFARLWVFQEVMLARTFCLVCGGAVLDGDLFADAVRAPFEVEGGLAGSAASSGPKGTGAQAVLEYRDALRGIDIISPAVIIAAARLTRLAGQKPVFASLLQDRQLAELQATDRRDYVYALLGIATDAADLGFAPDYSKTWQQTFADAALFVLRSDPAYGLTRVLLQCSRRERQSAGLPSWVPDWTTGKLKALPLVGDYGFEHEMGEHSPSQPPSEPPSAQPFAAAGRKKQALSFVGAPPSVLGMKGACFDSVSEVGPTTEDAAPGAHWGAPAAAWLDAFFALLGRSCGRYNESADLVVYRTALTDIVLDQNVKARVCRMDPQSYSAGVRVFNHFRAAARDEGHDCGDCRSFTLDVLYRSYHRRAFCTSRGFLGLGQCMTQPGDMVLLILGVPFPGIFRKSSSGRVQFIGDAYVHGIMDGEFMTGGVEVETFHVE